MLQYDGFVRTEHLKGYAGGMVATGEVSLGGHQKRR
jgi:hypothetical protein